MQQEFLKVNDVAELLQLSPRQILNLCKSDAKKDTPTPSPDVEKPLWQIANEEARKQSTRSSTQKQGNQ